MSEATPRILIEGYTAAEIEQITEALRGVQGAVADPDLVLDMDALVTWLQEQAADESLEQAVMAGALDRSPLDALMDELIRRARS